MAEVEIKLEREGLEGIVAEGSYLIDAMKRLGKRFDGVCEPHNGIHFCAVSVTKGAGILSAETSAEAEYFAKNEQGDKERLACQAKLERGGDVTIMTKEKKEEPAAAAADREAEYRKEFTELPLEKKIANLLQLEAIALGETVSFVINSPFKIFEKAMDVMAEFGVKLEKQAKDATRPKEHAQAENGAAAEEHEDEKAGKTPHARKPKA
jgi:ferredoxin